MHNKVVTLAEILRFISVAVTPCEQTTRGNLAFHSPLLPIGNNYYLFCLLIALSVGELQRVISESSSFIFYGTERFLGSLPPSMLAPMNITGISFTHRREFKKLRRQLQRKRHIKI